MIIWLFVNWVSALIVRRQTQKDEKAVIIVIRITGSCEVAFNID